MKKTKNFWLAVLLVGTAISVPEGTLIRVVANSLDVATVTALRYTAAAIFASPFVITAVRNRKLTLRRLLYMMLVAVPLSLDPLASQYVTKTTSASFHAILGLFIPIIFAIISTIITKDKISRIKIIGLLFAVLGGMVMVALPSLDSGPVNGFGLVPVALVLIEAVCVSLEIIIWRKENERGNSLIVILGSFYLAWAIVATIIMLALGEAGQLQHLTFNNLIIIIYLGVVASVIYNAVFTSFYRHVGTTSAATMKYFKKALTIIMPIVVLGETLTWQIALGALLIIVGSLVVQMKPK